MEAYDRVAGWFYNKRGIEKETLEHFGVKVEGTAEDPTILLPYVQGEKTRKGLFGEKRKFFFTPGIKPSLYNLGDSRKNTVFLVEGETDTMRLWQEFHSGPKPDTVGVCGLSGVDTWRPELADALKEAQVVYVVLDNDDDYMVVAQVDAAWKKIRADLGTKARRLRLPQGVKDICEFFDAFDLSDLREIARTRQPNKSRYTPLNLRKPPPPPNWLVEGLVSKGDVTLLAGPPSVGKSWFTMGLTVAIIEGHSHFLGQPLNGVPARVLYVDQENPDDVIFHRLRQLGMSDTGLSNLRYLWNCGIRLDRDPQDFVDEALDYDPALIVLDSLTRLHTQDENSAGSMAPLFNAGVQPLARETGAAVILIHHDNKQGDPRGSVDIMASADAALQARSLGEANPGTFVLRQIKSRRRLGGGAYTVKIEDMPNGAITLNVSPETVPPF